jgi:hypothetical protein
MTDRQKTGLRRWLKGQMLKRVHRMITCREFDDFVLRYLDDDLTIPQKTVFELHMRICRECRDYLAAYQRAMELGKSVLPSPDDPLPDDVPEDLVKAILSARIE